MTEEEIAAATEAASVEMDARTGRIVRIRWTDSGMAVHGWTQRSQMPTEMPAIETVGLWFGETDNVVMVAGSHDKHNDNWGECQLIWKPSITALEWLGDAAS